MIFNKATRKYQVWHYTKADKRLQWVLVCETASYETAHKKHYELEKAGQRADLKIIQGGITCNATHQS